MRARLALLLAVLVSMETAIAAPIRILAFGDSLTEGFTAGGVRMYPYANKLDELFKQDRIDVEVVASGVSGERVLVTMRDRLERELAKEAADGKRFDWVLILAGINDIGWSEKPQQVFHSLLKMYRAATEHGARVLVMTCMENRGSHIRPVTEIDQARQKLNMLIREYAMKNRGPKGAVLVDLESLMPYRLHDDSAKWFDFDGLHLTTLGYDMLARLLHATLKMEINKRQST